MGKWKMIAKPIVFLLLFFAMGLGFTRLLTPYWGTTTNQSETFYALPEDAIDVMTVGSSSLLVSVSPLVMWDAQGITSLFHSTSVAPLITYYNVTEELEYQNPEVVIIGTMYLFDEYDVDKEENESYLRATMDTRRAFKAKTGSNWRVQKSDYQTWFDYLFPIVRDPAASLNEDVFYRNCHLRTKKEYYRFCNKKKEVLEDQRNITQLTGAVDDCASTMGKRLKRVWKRTTKVFCSPRRVDWTYAEYSAVPQLADEYGVDLSRF